MNIGQKWVKQFYTSFYTKQTTKLRKGHLHKVTSSDICKYFVIHNLKQTSTITPSRQVDNHSPQWKHFNKVHDSCSLVDLEQVTKHWGLLCKGLLYLSYSKLFTQKRFYIHWLYPHLLVTHIVCFLYGILPKMKKERHILP